jgi:mannose/fructose/N-acetylgalactosamine-specific phosphotransferase system component IID
MDQESKWSKEEEKQEKQLTRRMNFFNVHPMSYKTRIPLPGSTEDII